MVPRAAAATGITGGAIAIALLAGGPASFGDDYDLNEPPDCSTVVAKPSSLEVTGFFATVVLSGATDGDGDELTYKVDDVSQDESVFGPPGSKGPDAAAARTSNAVQLRAERNPRGNGRVYHIGFTVSDGTDSCTGITNVEVRRTPKIVAVDDGPRYDSFTGAELT
jgi:hypothetical protein